MTVDFSARVRGVRRRAPLGGVTACVVVCATPRHGTYTAFADARRSGVMACVVVCVTPRHGTYTAFADARRSGANASAMSAYASGLSSAWGTQARWKQSCVCGVPGRGRRHAESEGPLKPKKLTEKPSKF